MIGKIGCESLNLPANQPLYLRSAGERHPIFRINIDGPLLCPFLEPVECRHDEGPDGVLPVPDYYRLKDERAFEQEGFQMLWQDLFSVRQYNQVFLAVCDNQVTVFVNRPLCRPCEATRRALWPLASLAVSYSSPA